MTKAINKHFFDEESKEMWYVLGVSFSRYYPQRDKPYNTWSSQYLGLIQIVKRELKSDHKIITSNSFILRMRNEHLQSKLFERGCIPGKENRKFPEDVEDQYLDHFIRGFFDAQTTAHEDPLLIQIYFNNDFLRKLHEHFVRVGSVRNREILDRPALNYGSASDIAGVHDFLYRDWEFIQRSGLYLPSKKERFEA